METQTLWRARHLSAARRLRASWVVRLPSGSGPSVGFDVVEEVELEGWFLGLRPRVDRFGGGGFYELSCCCCCSGYVDGLCVGW